MPSYFFSFISLVFFPFLFCGSLGYVSEFHFDLSVVVLDVSLRIALLMTRWYMIYVHNTVRLLSLKILSLPLLPQFLLFLSLKK